MTKLVTDFLSGGRKSRDGASSRKLRRRVERDQKKAQRNAPPPLKRQKIRHEDPVESDPEGDGLLQPLPTIKALQDVDISKPKSILKTTKLVEKTEKTIKSAREPKLSKTVSRTALDKLAEDDAEIAFLEKKLGLKGKKGLSKAFKDEGLDELLNGLDKESDDEDTSEKRKRDEGNEWLAQKRRKAGSQGELEDEGSNRSSDEGSFMSLENMAFDEEGDDETQNEDEEELDEDDDFGGFDSDSGADSQDNTQTSPSPPRKRVRENPYVAPVSSSNLAATKYVPPSLRKPSSADSEVLTRLRRQLQGLVNRLTETNLISILGDIEKMYRDNARQHITSILIELLLTSVCEPTALPDTLIILPAGFIAAVYKIIGTDFGAQVIEKVAELFADHYSQAAKLGNSGPDAATSDSRKETSNLITLLAELYNFQVVGSNLMFDYVRLFLSTLSELNAELLLKLIRTSGPQLRHDDPSSLKDIVNMLRPAVTSAGEANLSVRTKFMIETINDLKNNRMKTGAVASAVTSEHTVRMKKILGTLNTRNIKASEPLRIGLEDLLQADKKGKWWLVGASWAGAETKSADHDDSHHVRQQKVENDITTSEEPGLEDLTELAREHRMNTDIRRAVFITIMSASDFQDANLRLRKLKLKKAQELEIPKVLIHCASAEKAYNPYYTLIAKKLCNDRKLKMAFQFCLWDIFKNLAENEDNEDAIMKDEEGVLDARQLVNLAKMFGALIAEGDLTLGVLKNLNLSYLQPRTKTFVEVMLITVLLQSQGSVESRDEQAVRHIILKAKMIPQLSLGLQYFLRKTISKTDLAGGKIGKATIKWACKIAANVLSDTRDIVDLDEA